MLEMLLWNLMDPGSGSGMTKRSNESWSIESWMDVGSWML